MLRSASQLLLNLDAAYLSFLMPLTPIQALGILQPRSPSGIAASLQPYATRIHSLAGLIAVTAISGAFVAGMQV
jgi:hypothetical protein